MGNIKKDSTTSLQNLQPFMFPDVTYQLYFNRYGDTPAKTQMTIITIEISAAIVNIRACNATQTRVS